MSAVSYQGEVVAPQIDFDMRRTVAPRYKWLKVPLNNMASNSVTLSNGTTTVLEWKLPTRVYNLARSYISATVYAAKGAVGTFNNMYEDTFDLGNNITFGSSQGVDLVNLSFAGNYAKIIRRIDTKLEDYLGNDVMTNLYKCNSLAAVNILPATNTGASDNYLETQYMTQGVTATAGAGVGDLYRYRQYPLGIFSGTLLGVDRDFYAPIEQYLRITAGIPEKATWNTATADPTNTPIVNATGITYSNLYLYLCVEQNPVIVLGMVKRYEERKMVYRIPYTTGFKTVGTTSAGSITNVNLNFPQQYGKRLKRIIHTPYYPVETLNTAYDCDNTGGKKIITYQTSLDSQQLQDHPLNCGLPGNGLANLEDWSQNKKYMEKSVYTSKESYQRNWFHVDQFYEPRDKDAIVDLADANIDEGLLMDSSKQWLFSATVGASGAQGNQGLVHYTFAEFQREVAMTELGGVFV